jgi:hypothetical protein
MKKNIAVWIILIISFAITGSASGALVAYYPFDANANDASGNGNNATVNGATLTTDKFGNKNGAYLFDGANDYITAPVDINPSTMPQMTIVAWARADNGSPFKQVVSHDNGGYDRSLDIDSRGGGTGWSAFCGSGGVSGFHPITLGEWVFLAVVYDQNAGTVQLRVNDTTYEKAGVLGSGYSTFLIGSNPRYGEYFKGAIDEVRIYDHALSDSEITALFMGDFSVPTSLSAKPKSSTQITIGWKDNSTDETGFKIEKKTGACDSANSWAQIATKASNTTIYNVTNLTPNTSYSFRVRAYQSSSNSNYSNCVTAKTSAADTPPAPTNFKAISASSTKVNLTWSDNSTNETGFKIYRKAGAGTWALLTTTATDVKNFSDTAATNNTTTTTYQYYIVASNASGISPATYPSNVPYSPINLAAAQGTTAGSIKLTWEDKSADETGFEIWRKTGDCLSTSAWNKVATLGANKTSWTDTGRTSGSTYAYKIRAYKKSGSILTAYGYSMYSNCDDAIAP